MRRAIVQLLLAASAVAQDVEREVVARLLDRDVGAWARDLEAEPLPREPRELMIRLQVLLRAGHLDRLPEVIDALAGAPDAGWVAEMLVDRGATDLARRALERLAPGNCVDEFVEAWPATDETKARWLAAQVERDDLFFHAWVRFHARRRTAGPVLETLEGGVRGQPLDMRRIERYLWARREAGVRDEPSWLVEVVRPRLAVESYWFAERLRGWPRLEVFYLERSLSQPFTAEDAELARSRMSIPLDLELHRGPDRIRELLRREPDAGRGARIVAPGGDGLIHRSAERHVRGGAKFALADAYQRCGEASKAQPLVEELARQYPEGPPAALAALAGHVQRESGKRVIEGRVREKEAERGEDAQYWHARAEYFAGRKEDAEARAAFERALGLSPPSQERSQIVDAFARYLFNAGSGSEAETLLDRSLTEAEPGSDYAYARLSTLLRSADFRSAFPSPDDERLWRHLAARPVWHDEREMLERMARRAPARAALWRRAAALTGDADPSRALMLADAMMRLEDYRDAIPLLRAAPHGRAQGMLFRALVEVNDWKAAEAMVLDLGDPAGRLGDVAIAARRAGETDEAMRIWRRRTNLDRLSLEDVRGMAEAAGRDALVSHYAEIGARDPRFQWTMALAKSLK